LFNGSSVISDEPFLLAVMCSLKGEESLIDFGIIICHNENGPCEELSGFNVKYISKGGILFIRIPFIGGDE